MLAGAFVCVQLEVSGLLERIHFRDSCHLKSEFSHSLEGFEFRPVCKPCISRSLEQRMLLCQEVNDEAS